MTSERVTVVSTPERSSLWLGIGAGAVIGTIAYELALRLLTAWNVAVWHHGRDPARDIALWAATAAVVVLTVAAYRRRPTTIARRAAVAGMLLGGGAAWVGWGLFDQHVLKLFEISPSSNPILWDTVWHGAGAVVAGIGWLRWSDATSRRG
jgi:hypothetical protein